MNKQLTSGRIAGLVLFGAFALSGAVFMLVMGVASPIVGALSDKVGPLKTVLIGSLLGGASLSAASVFSQSFPIFVLTYGVVAAFALASMTYVPMGILVDRLFQERNKGLAYAIVTNGTSLGFIILSPLWIYMAPRFDWQIVFLGVGLIFLIPISLAMFFCSRTELSAPTADEVLPGTWSAVLKDPRFFALGLSFMSCGATMAFVDVHLVPFWEDSHVSRTAMGLSLSTLGLLELFSGVAAGWLASRYAKNQLLAAFYLLRTLAMVMLLSHTEILLTYVFAAVFGISYLGTVVLTSAYCFDLYGPRIKGQAFGALFFIHQIGAFIAVRWGGLIYDATLSYTKTI
jgi:MFS family permease